MEQVAEGIFRLQVEMPGPLGHVNCYALEDQGERILVDTGPDVPVSRQSLARELGALGWKLEEVSHVVITHGHPDHCGLLARMHRTYGIPFWIHPLDAEYYESMHRGDLAQMALEWIDREVPKRTAVQVQAGLQAMMEITQEEVPWHSLNQDSSWPEPNSGVFQVGRVVWQILHTPGHSPGHVCLYEPHRGVLLTGDHVLPDETPHIGLSLDLSKDPLADFLASLRALNSLSVRLVLPGHGQPFEDLPERVGALLAHHHERLRRVQDAVRQGAQTIYEVALRLPWTSREVAFDELNPVDQLLALQETAAHLWHLVAEGRLHRVQGAGPSRYRCW